MLSSLAEPAVRVSLMIRLGRPIRGSRKQGGDPLMPVDVMIVDDSAAIRKILHRVLLQADVPLGKVIEAGDGVEALEKLKTHKVGLILSDINMPNMDGLALLGALKAQEATRDVPVIMVTTEGSSSRVMEAVNLGASGYVRKPFTAEQIKEKLAGLF
jgi:two-component system chemotaxis response regulator CheY